MVRWASAELGPVFEVLDMRPESVVMRDGVIVERQQLAGDPRGEESIDLGQASAFVDANIDPARLRGSDYDPAVTASSHSDGRHTYSVCRTFLEADLLIVVPKVKTHKKVGLSLAMKNLVGMVGEKNCLPHHTAGFPARGGDEYPDRSPRAVLRQWSAERVRPLLARGRGVGAIRMARRFERRTFRDIPARSGNWWGNDTAWRMALDLVTVLRRERREKGRPTLFVYDGLVAGEGEGPLAPDAVELGLLAASDDPVAGDVAVAGEVGVAVQGIPLLREALARGTWAPDSAQAQVEVLGSSDRRVALRLHPGWTDAPGLTVVA
jgi:hypothetical protein